MAVGRANGLLSSPLGVQVLHLLSHARLDLITDDELMWLLLDARSRVSLYQADYDQHVAELRSRAPELAELAEWLSQRLEHGWDDLDRNRQVWVTTGSDPAEADRMVADLSPYSLEVSKPRRTFWTSTFNSAVVSPWLQWLIFGEDPRPAPYYRWNVTVAPSARIFEIHSPTAWAALAQAYPSSHEAFRYSPQYGPQIVRPAGLARLDPDWSKVSQDWDGVHLSIGGWLTTEDVPYRSGRVTTELRGWDMESTAWFGWPFSSVESSELEA